MSDTQTIQPTTELLVSTPATKQGWKTTEFWLSMIVFILIVLSGAGTIKLSPTEIIAAATTSGLYSGGRSIYKAFTS